MAYRSFQHFLETLESCGELKRIPVPVNASLELAEIADRVMKSAGPALLFEKVVGPPIESAHPNPESAVMGSPSKHVPNQDPAVKPFQMPVAINTFGSRKRMSLALSCEDYEEHAARIESLLKPEVPNGAMAAVRKLAQVFGEVKGVLPKHVTNAPCQERAYEGEAVDLGQLPVLTCWPEDGGPFITLPLVFTHDPNTGKRNVGMYRMQVYDRRTCGMHWQMHKTGMRQMEDAGEQGKRLEVCVVLGSDPACTFSAIAPLPPGIDEMMFAGFLRRERVPMVRAKSVDMEVPADAEIVIEGYVDPSERRLEGPFGDHTGYYSLAAPFPVLHVTALTMRNSPVYPATIVGQPPMEDGWMGKAVERIFLPLIRLSVPEIVDINLPVEAAFHNVAFVSIRKKYPGHAYKAMNAIWGLGGLAFTKFVFVFDADCDVQNLQEVLFRLGANCDPMRDTLAGRGPVDQLDHASVEEGFGGKLGFDCTHKLPGENGFARQYPKLITMSSDVKARVDELWPRLGL